jgi:hypothetical protein
VEEDEEDVVKRLLTDWVILLDNAIDLKPPKKDAAEKQKVEARGAIIRDAAMRSLKPGRQDLFFLVKFMASGEE